MKQSVVVISLLAVVVFLCFANFLKLSSFTTYDSDGFNHYYMHNDNLSTGRTTTSRVTTTTFIVDPMFQEQYDIIDGVDKKERCTKFGFYYNEKMDIDYSDNGNNGNNDTITTPTTATSSIAWHKNTGRRIFFGAMVADEGYDIVRIHAAEVHGLYHVVALVESQRTFLGTKRNLRFAKGTPGYDLVMSGIFGPHTQVYVDVFDDNFDEAKDMDYEEIQREAVLYRWKKAGMHERDVGLLADIDESPSREFVHVGKHCDIPAFRPKQNCHRPKVNMWSLVFEGSPDCLVDGRTWYHPDFIIGECIEHIGNPHGRPTPERIFKGIEGIRMNGWGYESYDDYSADLIKNGSYPLANNADFRGGVFNAAEQQPLFSVCGYHFHNFFGSAFELRNKYKTYGHPLKGALKWVLSKLHEDLDLMVRCARDLPNSANPNQTSFFWHESGLGHYIGPKPIYFLNKTYRRERHAQLKRLISEDETSYGSDYNASEMTLPPIIF